MTHPKSTRGPWIAAAALVLALPGVHAQPSPNGSASPTRMEVVGHLSARAACPAIDAQLPDELWHAWHAVGTPASVLVEFKLRGRDAYDITPLSGPLQYRPDVRRAVRSLTCDSHDDQVHDVRVDILFLGAGRHDAARR